MRLDAVLKLKFSLYIWFLIFYPNLVSFHLRMRENKYFLMFLAIPENEWTEKLSGMLKVKRLTIICDVLHFKPNSVYFRSRMCEKSNFYCFWQCLENELS